jgi:Flp pilus assembly pilin Flp
VVPSGGEVVKKRTTNLSAAMTRVSEGELGQTLVEYSLILLLVALLVIVPVSQIGTTVTQFLTNVVGAF